MADLEGLVEKILRIPPHQQFLLIAQLFTVDDRADVAWAIAKRLCDEHEAERIMTRLTR